MIGQQIVISRHLIAVVVARFPNGEIHTKLIRIL